ncbi:helix-turn-helix domain-containing protein [Edaphovirga cremea]|uniref:helix-turn-helix domain-containing protein n=1 Tax=Edaphovirga cremea TaxID=2267246 RepID=UPI000DEFB953|nr:helix-turn-helix domain-containing protein [Edaphovirga cremea]
MTEYNKDHDLIDELVNWIEVHLDTAPRIDMVSLKSGYSKWHLQRKFRDMTGINIATYMRNRRLAKCAIALKTSHESIIDIATQYSFDSQQTFTRAFKKRFATTPLQYRLSPDWQFDLLTPRFSFNDSFNLDVECVNLPEMHLKRLRNDVTLVDKSIEGNSRPNYQAIRDQMMCEVFSKTDVRKSPIITVMTGDTQNGEQNSLRYMLAENASTGLHDSGQHLSVAGGEFVSIRFSGTVNESHKLTRYLFDEVLPELRKKITASQEIEQINFDDEIFTSRWAQSKINYHYLLSVN